MTCAHVQERLDDYVDGLLGEAEFQEMELHLHDCPECREQERELRALLAAAAALPVEIPPSRDLWPQIEGRLGPRVPRAGWRRFTGSAWTLAALAAAAAVVLALSTTLRQQPRLTTPVAPVAEAPREDTTPTLVPAAAWQPLPAEQGYLRATEQLLAAYEAHRSELAPETVTVVEGNLKIIDAALAQIREALRKDPTSTELSRLLSATHERKVQVLRRVTRAAA
jgi:anti-sigma factor RsiW